MLEQKIASLEGPPTNSNAFPSEESYSVDNEDDDDDVFWKKDNHFPNSMDIWKITFNYSILRFWLEKLNCG